MRVNNSGVWAVSAESEGTVPQIWDLDDADMQRGPAIQFRVGAVGITDVPNDYTFVMGFIQFITKYTFRAYYEQGTVDIRLPVPINDSDPTQSQKPTPEQVALDYPFFYDHPVRILAQADGARNRGHLNFKHYALQAADAPSFKFPLYHDGDAANPLLRVKRFHEFETWAVIWNRRRSQIEMPLVRFVWAHAVDARVDVRKGVGRRIRFAECYSKELPEKRQVGRENIKDDQGALANIPAAMLGAPTANVESARHRFYRDDLVHPPLLLDRRL